MGYATAPGNLGGKKPCQRQGFRQMEDDAPASLAGFGGNNLKRMLSLFL
jgi:hypothetical protein